jgi:hemerythrin
MTTATFPWSDRYLVGSGAIDDAHREFAALLDALLGAADDEVLAALDAVERHCVAHFALEESLMRQYAYPPGDCHADEHERVLASLREVRALVADGDVQIGRDVAQALADWFPGHADVMDSAVAIWVVRKTTGGAPLVLRRAVATA